MIENKVLIIREWAKMTPTVEAFLIDRYGKESASSADVLRINDKLTADQLLTENIVILAEIYNNVYHAVESLSYLTDKQKVIILLQKDNDFEVYDMQGSDYKDLFSDFALAFMKRNRKDNVIIKALSATGILTKYATVFDIEQHINPKHPIGAVLALMATILVLFVSLCVGVVTGPFIIFSGIYQDVVLKHFQVQDKKYWTKKFSIREVLSR